MCGRWPAEPCASAPCLQTRTAGWGSSLEGSSIRCSGRRARSTYCLSMSTTPASTRLQVGHTHAHTHVQARMHTHTHTHTHTQTDACTHACLHTHTHTDRQKDTQTQTHAQLRTHTYTHTHTHTQTHTHARTHMQLLLDARLGCGSILVNCDAIPVLSRPTSWAHWSTAVERGGKGGTPTRGIALSQEPLNPCDLSQPNNAHWLRPLPGVPSQEDKA